MINNETNNREIISDKHRQENIKVAGNNRVNTSQTELFLNIEQGFRTSQEIYHVSTTKTPGIKTTKYTALGIMHKFSALKPLRCKWLHNQKIIKE